ncbi:hypothetical protein NDU88_001370 [Pleurodeles waltl]|uniref:Secreted protein n=1 Tax=Pleurodeles waltl TaxID=8319 RepID=A0AAV7VZQ1_PLEWA|nr:hypothetical protein NDU88_001370 [Pleurodeles waltl]
MLSWGLLPLRLLCCVPLSGEHSPSGLKAGVRAPEIAHTPRGAAGPERCLRSRFFTLFFSSCACSFLVLCAPFGGQHSNPKGARDAKCPSRHRGGARLADQSARTTCLSEIRRCRRRRARSSSPFSLHFVVSSVDYAGFQIARSSPL